MIDAKSVAELRSKTGAGMMDCKKALTESNGDLEKAKDLIYMAKEAGANAAKFQHFKAKTIVSDYGFKNLGSKVSHQQNWNKSVYEVYKDAEVP